MKDKIKEILRTSYTGMDLDEDLAAERILNLFSVIEIVKNNGVLDDVSNCEHYWLYPVSSHERKCKKCNKLENDF